MSETKITFDGTHTPMPAACGCELRGSTAVLLCPLHAAAPELLDALKWMCLSHGMHGPCEQNDCSSCQLAYDKADAAIAKAASNNEEVRL